MRRSRFLPVFFTLLSIAFVIALVIRLRSDMRELTVASAKAPAAPVRMDTVGSPPLETSAGGKQPSVRPASARTREAAMKARQDEALSGVRSIARPQPQPQPQPRPQPASKPSILSRVLAPVMKALGGGSTATSTTTPKPAAAPSQSQASSHGSSSSATSTHASDKQEAKDPNSDTTPPQLISVEFSPPQVQDGEEATVIINAMDDLSGIRGVSGTISSPTGKALQGFATQREGDTSRYVGRVAIAKNAEQGLWKVNFINMSDNASNSVTLSYATGGVPQTAVLRVVSSNSDSTPPTLKNIWPDKRAIHGGEKAIIFVEAVDDKSGVNLVSAVFQSPTRVARIGAGCQRGDGDVWQCELSVPTCIDCGDWQLEQVTLQDKANNLATFRQDNPLVLATKINIGGAACDNTPPALQSLVLDNNDVILGDHGAIVTVTIVATDDNCGVAGASGQFVGPGTGSGGFFPMQQSGDSSTFTGRIQLDARAARGVWRINSIQLNDRGHNLKVYYATDPLLANGVFRVR